MTVVEDGAITRAGYHFTTNDGISYSLLSLILQNGGSYLGEDGTFTFQTPEAQASMELMKSYVDEEIVDPTLFTDTANWVGDCYFTELCAMGLVGPWVVPEYATDFPEVTANTEYVPLPTLENSSFAADSGWGLTVSSNSPEQELAWDFVSYVAQNEQNALDWNLATGTLPALKANTQGDARDQLLADATYLAPWLDILGDAEYVGSLLDRDRLFYRIIVPNVLDYLNGRRASRMRWPPSKRRRTPSSQGHRHGHRSPRAPPATDPRRVGRGGRLTAPQTRFRRIVLGPIVLSWPSSRCSLWCWVFALSLFNYSPRREGASIGGLGGDNPSSAWRTSSSLRLLEPVPADADVPHRGRRDLGVRLRSCCRSTC